MELILEIAEGRHLARRPDGRRHRSRAYPGDRTLLGWHAGGRTADPALQQLRKVLLLSQAVLPLLPVTGRGMARRVRRGPPGLLRDQLPAPPARRPSRAAGDRPDRARRG